MSPLYKRRQELARIAERELQGELFWTEKFSVETRNRLQLVMKGSPGGRDFNTYEVASRVLLQDLGELSLREGAIGDDRAIFFDYLSRCDDEMVPSVIEAFGEGYVRAFERNAHWDNFSKGVYSEESRIALDSKLIEGLNRVFAEDRIAFEFIDGEMVPFSSRELHVEVTQPVLRLLREPGWERVESSYRDALAQISGANGANAITDAGTALQEALVLLGAKGNQIGDLATSAREKGIIAAHDLPLLQVLDKACRWVSADRSNTGDAHNADDATNGDAWFTVHVVGAIILRLSNGRRALVAE